MPLTQHSISEITCASCRNFAWTRDMDPVADTRGALHHPSCTSCVNGCGRRDLTPQERSLVRSKSRR